MNPEQNFKEEGDKKVEQKPNALNSVTPLSKYLAMILFVTMPFLGGWIGYTYAPTKVIEKEKIIYRESVTPNPAPQTYERIINESFFEIEDGKMTNFFNPNEIIYIFSADLLSQLNLVSVDEKKLKTSNAVTKGDSSGEYYIAVNEVDSYESCVFSNKIYFLNINTTQLNLLYEENNHSLPPEDPRSCNKEMILMGTEDNKLIIQYHTLETGGVCDRKWGYPEKMWYLDTEFPLEGTKKYETPNSLYQQAIDDMEECVKGLAEF